MIKEESHLEELRLIALNHAVDVFKTCSGSLNPSNPTPTILKFAKEFEEYLLNSKSCEQDAPGCTGDSVTCVCGEKI